MYDLDFYFRKITLGTSIVDEWAMDETLSGGFGRSPVRDSEMEKRMWIQGWFQGVESLWIRECLPVEKREGLSLTCISHLERLGNWERRGLLEKVINPLEQVIKICFRGIQVEMSRSNWTAVSVSPALFLTDS